MEGTAMRPMAGAQAPASRAGWLAWASVALFAVLATVSLFLEVRFVGRATLLDIWAVIALAASGLVGALIVSAHPRHPIGWMFCAAAVIFGVSFFATQYAILALVVQPGTLPFGQAMAWFGFWAEMPGIAVVALFLPLLFPDGHLPSPRWRPVASFAAATVVLAVLFTMVAPDTYANAGYPSIRNPVGLDQYKALFDALGNAMQPLLFGLVVVSAVALFNRVRRADANERQQLKWFAYAGGLILLSFVVEALARFVPSLMVLTDVVTVLAITALPAAVGIAILRNRLYDVDLIINRTVVYVLLTAALAGVYTASVALFQRMFVAMTGQGSDIAIVMTLFVLATVFTPVKNTLQETVDRRIKPTRSHVAQAAARVSGIDDLLMLSELHDRGVLTDEEFSAKKKQLLLLSRALRHSLEPIRTRHEDPHVPARNSRSTTAPSDPSGLAKVNVSTIVVSPSRGMNSCTCRNEAKAPRTMTSSNNAGRSRRVIRAVSRWVVPRCRALPDDLVPEVE